jgi:hypothetical protein
MSKNFRGLSDAQSAAFEQIAIINDGGHNLRVIQSLLAKGLIERRMESRGGGFHAFRYDVPLPVHVEWCEWCSRQPDETETTGSVPTTQFREDRP